MKIKVLFNKTYEIQIKSTQREIYYIKLYIVKEEKSHIDNISFHLKTQESCPGWCGSVD